MEIMHATYGKFFRKDVISDISFSEKSIFEDYSFFIESFLNSDNVFYDKQIKGIRRADMTSYDHDIISISNSFIEISKKYNFYEDLKNFLFNNKILRTYLHFINVEDEYKKEFFDKIKSDFNFFKNEIKTCYLESINEYIFKEALKCEDYNEFELSVMLFKYKERIDSLDMNFRRLHKNEFARIDIKNFGNASNSFEILEISDQKSKVSFPKRLKTKRGNGAVIESYSKELSLKLKIINDGNLKLLLRSIYLRDESAKRIKILIDYTSLSIDGINYLDGHNLFWHDEPFILEKKVNNSDIMNLHITWDVYGAENPDLDDESKEDIYVKIRKELLDSTIDSYYLKKMPLGVYGFYIAVLNNESFKEYSYFNKNLLYPIRHINKKELSSEINYFKDSGINAEKRDKSIIISLTSIPERMYDIHFCLYSLLKQNLKPDEVILWLACEQFPNKEKDIPNNVLKLKNNGLTIKWCNDIKSYKKLIPALKENPNDFIVTADDDIYYPPDWLEKMWNTYVEYPNTIISSRPKVIIKDSNGEMLRYNYWPYPDELKEPSFLNFPTGAGGTMYFPDALSGDVLDEETFMELCPAGDDIWFWAMAVKNNTKITGIENPYIKLIYVNPARELSITDLPTLWNLNKDGGNDIQIKNVFKNFPEIMEILNDENEVFYAE